MFWRTLKVGCGITAAIGDDSSTMSNVTQFDGHTPANKFSITRPHSFIVSEHEQCEVKVSVRPETHSGEYKVRLAGMMVEDGELLQDNNFHLGF